MMVFGEQQDIGMRNAGFTLVELLVALAIMAIIAAVALPLYPQFSDRAFRTEAQADMLDCAQALERFASISFSYENAADTARILGPRPQRAPFVHPVRSDLTP